jgi:hypothetical protein
LPDNTQIVSKIKFLDETDKSGGKFLNAALTAIIEKFTAKTNSVRPTKKRKVNERKAKNRATRPKI